MILLDASVLIAYLDSEDNYHTAAERLLAASIEDEFAVNTLTLAEVLVVPARDDRLDTVLAVLRDLEVAELPFPADSAVRLAQLRADTGLKMPDCCVLLAAEAAGAYVASFDDRLMKAAEARELRILPQ
ncbi:MAG: type II toxin-antitoxin system VapC family toxin [Pseudonocardiaceae bacterium]